MELLTKHYSNKKVESYHPNPTYHTNPHFLLLQHVLQYPEYKYLFGDQPQNLLLYNNPGMNQ